MNRLAVAIAVVLIILVVAILFIFRGDNEPSNPAKREPLPLNEYATDETSEVVFTTRGQINGDDIHRNIVISVSSSERRIDIIQGYEGNIISRQSFANNESAYREFLNAIKNAGFMAKKSKVTTENPEGQCPTGQLYYYTLEQDDSVLSELWSGSCSNKVGTSAANRSLIQTLFKNQITNYNQITSNVSL